MSKGICSHFSKCQFYQKYCRNLSRKEKITIFHEYISVYCYGPLRGICHRLTSAQQYGKLPPADITPSGAQYTTPQECTGH